jgi:hypothetical protein
MYPAGVSNLGRGAKSLEMKKIPSGSPFTLRTETLAGKRAMLCQIRQSAAAS